MPLDQVSTVTMESTSSGEKTSMAEGATKITRHGSLNEQSIPGIGNLSTIEIKQPLAPFIKSGKQPDEAVKEDPPAVIHFSTLTMEANLSTDNSEEIQRATEVTELSPSDTPAELRPSAIDIGRPSATKAFIENPKLYSKRIQYLKSQVFEHGRECLDISTHLGSLVISLHFDLTTRNQNHHIYDLVRRGLRVTSGITQSLDLLHSSEFSSTTYNIIVVDPQRDSVLRVVPITKAHICLLQDILQGALDTVEHIIRGAQMERSLLRESMVDIGNASCSFLKHMGLYIENGKNTVNQQADGQTDDQYNECISNLKLMSAAISALFLGLVSYVSSHTGDFDIDNSLLESNVEEIRIQTTNTPIYLSRQRLACLDPFVGHPVWTFSITPPALEPNQCYLSTLLADFADLWGPVDLLFVDEGQDMVEEIGTQGGSIRKSCLSSADVQSGEVLCHWQSWCDTGIDSSKEILAFSPRQTLLIGAEDKKPSFRVNESCVCPRTASRYSSRGEKYTLNTKPTSYKLESRSASISFSKVVSLSLGQSWKVHPATTMKDVIIEDWLTNLRIYPSHDPDPAYLDYHIVIEISGCKGHARRISFWSMLKNECTMKYIKQTFGPEFKNTISALSGHDILTEAWASMAVENRDRLKHIVLRILENLKGTGATTRGVIQAWDISSSLGFSGRRISPSWGSMVKDSSITATFVIITDGCFGYDDPTLNPKVTILYTKLCITVHFEDDAGNDFELETPGEHDISSLEQTHHFIAGNGKIAQKFLEEPAGLQSPQLGSTSTDTPGGNGVPLLPAQNSPKDATTRHKLYAATRENYPSVIGGLSLEAELTRISKQSAERRQERGIRSRYEIISSHVNTKASLHLRNISATDGSVMGNTASHIYHPSIKSLFICTRILPFRGEEGLVGELHLDTDGHGIGIGLDSVLEAKWKVTRPLWRPRRGLGAHVKAVEDQSSQDFAAGNTLVEGPRSWRASCAEFINGPLDCGEKMIWARII